MRHLFYLVGIPGVGKTTVFRKALADIPAEQHTRPFGWIAYPGGAQLGVDRGVFSGTDALSMNVQPRVLEWLNRCDLPCVVAEGDRLANGQFFDAVVAQGWLLTVGLLELDPAIAATRRDMRGSSQNPSWLRGRHTKVANLTRYYVSAEWRLNARQPVELLATRLKKHPAFQGLAGDASQT